MSESAGDVFELTFDTYSGLYPSLKKTESSVN